MLTARQPHPSTVQISALVLHFLRLECTDRKTATLLPLSERIGILAPLARLEYANCTAFKKPPAAADISKDISCQIYAAMAALKNCGFVKSQ